MDAHVEIKVLQHERDFMQGEIRKLEQVIELVRTKQSAASMELDGNQFDIASKEISNLVRTINNTILHFNLLIAQLDKMVEDVSKYVASGYGGN